MSVATIFLKSAQLSPDVRRIFAGASTDPDEPEQTSIDFVNLLETHYDLEVF